MWLLLLAYLGGVLTIASPCVLPILPFVFSRTGQPFTRSGLPMLAGLVVMFALVASLAAVSSAWVVRANQYGRWFAMALIALFALGLLLPRLAQRLARPLVAAGNRLVQAADGRRDDERSSPGLSFLLGIATGLLWTPCAGPILGLVLTGAAIQGVSVATLLLLLAYAAGAATSLAAALLIGGRLLKAMKRSLGIGEWVCRALGAAMLVGVGAIALGVDTAVLAKTSLDPATGIEQALVSRLAALTDVAPAARALGGSAASSSLPVEGVMPSLAGAVRWLNSPPLTAKGLRGKVVLVDFWTYSCVNCLRTLPYVEAWAAKYRDAGLVVVGVHAPEFAFERDVANVKRAVRRLGVNYPVALDNHYAIWRAFGNAYWPADYWVDAQGRIRAHHFGEGDYAGSERIIQQLLKEAGAADVPGGLVDVRATGAAQAADFAEVRSPETYVGYQRAQRFSSGAPAPDQARAYSVSSQLPLNGWGLSGTWTIKGQRAVLDSPPGSVVYRFHARDLNLVLGPPDEGGPVRFKVLIDGKAPGKAHGVDVAPDGSGEITTQRMYQLVRQPGSIRDRTFSIQFFTPGASVYAFTFG